MLPLSPLLCSLEASRCLSFHKCGFSFSSFIRISHVFFVFHVGEGDTGDHWMVICDGDYWERDEGIMLKHVDTEV